MKDKVKQLEEQVSFLVGLLDERQLEEFTFFLHKQENKNGEENNKEEEYQGLCILPRGFYIRGGSLRTPRDSKAL